MSIDADTAGMIRGIGGFSGLDDDRIAAIAAATSLRSVAEGYAFYGEDDTSYDVYFIVSGVIGVRSRRPDAGVSSWEDDTELLILRSGSLFGVMSFLDGARRDMNVVARERSLVLRMDGPLLKAACEADPVVGRAVYALFGKAAARVGRDVTMELRNLSAERG